MTRKNKFWFSPALAIGLLLLLANSYSKDDDNGSGKTVMDIDGNVYKTITIGSQVWIAENLKTTKYKDGTAIPNVTDDDQWSNLITGAYCNYDNLESNAAIYGLLYNWYAVNTGKLAPEGWHAATDEDWTILANYVAGNLGASGTVAKALAAITNWATTTNDGAIGNDLNINNSSGFTAIPGGKRNYNGLFYDFGKFGYWWSSTESIFTNYAIDFTLNCGNGFLGRLDPNKECGFSVRLVRD